jgi:sphingomyelin phosphodiesterase
MVTWTRFNYLNIPDPAGELEWLSRQLLEAEQLGEKVHIIGHVPPGYSDCIPTWSKNYRRLIERFAHSSRSIFISSTPQPSTSLTFDLFSWPRFSTTITGQFFGHTHYDDIQIFYDRTGKPFNVAYIGPSVTPFVGINPAYRVYTFDSQTMVRRSLTPCQ